MRRFDNDPTHPIGVPERSEAEATLQWPAHNADRMEEAMDYKGPHTQNTLRAIAEAALAAGPSPRRMALADHLISRGDPRGERMMMNPAPIWGRAGDHFVKIHPPRPGEGFGRTKISVWVPFFGGSPTNDNLNIEHSPIRRGTREPWRDTDQHRRYYLPIESDVRDEDDAFNEPLLHTMEHLGQGEDLLNLHNGRLLFTQPPSPAVTTRNAHAIIGVPAGGITPEMVDHYWGRNEDPYGAGMPYRHMLGALHETAVPFDAIGFAGDFEDRITQHPLVLAHLPEHQFTPDWRKTWVYASTPAGPRFFPHAYEKPSRAQIRAQDEGLIDPNEPEQIAEFQAEHPPRMTTPTRPPPYPKRIWWAKRSGE